MNDQGKPPWDKLAEAAYLAYVARVMGKHYKADFKSLSRPMQFAWQAAIRHAGDCLQADILGQPWPDADKWADWVPGKEEPQ